MSKRDKEETVVVIFIEGETEIEFYKRFVGVTRTYCGGQLTCSLELINASGIGQNKDKVLRIFEKRIKKKYPNGVFCVGRIAVRIDTPPALAVDPHAHNR